MRECSIYSHFEFCYCCFFNDRTSDESCARQNKSYQGDAGQWDAGGKPPMFKSVEPFFEK